MRQPDCALTGDARPPPLASCSTVSQALFGMQDDKTKWLLTTPLTPEQLAWWQERMRHAIDHVRRRFPKARIVLRKLHRTDDSVVGTQYITNCEYRGFPASGSLS